MTLEERIRLGLIDYYLAGSRAKALKLAKLYYYMSGETEDEELAIAACIEAFFWLKLAGYVVSVDLTEPYLEELKDQLETAIRPLLSEFDSPPEETIEE